MRKNYSVFVMSSILQVSSEYFGFKKVLFCRLNEIEMISVNRCNWGILAGNKKRIVRDCLNRNVYNFKLINLICQETSERTRMHSSGMRTVRLLTASQHALGGGCLSRGCLPEGWWCLSRGVSAQGVSVQGVCLGMSAWGCLPRGCLPRPGGVCPEGVL